MFHVGGECIHGSDYSPGIPEIDDNDYPEVIDLGPFDQSQNKGDRAMPAIDIASRVYTIPEGAVEIKSDHLPDDTTVYRWVSDDPPD